MFINNRKGLMPVRRLLRNNATPQEVILWAYLKNSKTGFKFRRQTSISNFVVDFYCPKKRLAIEIDGSQHIDSESDIKRTRFLNEQGVQVLRFWNNEVNTNIEGVMIRIGEALTTPLR